MVEKQYKKHRYYTEDINAVKVVRIRVPEFNKANKASRVKNIISYYADVPVGFQIQVALADEVREPDKDAMEKMERRLK